MSHIDYSSDLLKHYVRRFGWLQACKKQKSKPSRKYKKISLKYFTFCAAEAIDVFMLEREQIVRRSQETGRLENVYFCEKDEEDFGKIADLIGSPEQGFQGDFAKIVLFNDDEETRDKSILDEEEYTPELRQKLRIKDAHNRFKEAFPFDIINLDVFGVMFPPRKGVIAPLLESLIKIIEWQSEIYFSETNQPCKKFTLFLTSHIDPDQTDAQAIQQLSNRLSANLTTNTSFEKAFTSRYNHNDVLRLQQDNFPEFFCLALPKFIIYRSLFRFGWKVTHGPTYLYNRDDVWKENKRYQIMHSVSVYERIPNFGQRLDDPGIEQYNQAVTNIVKDGVRWVEEFVEDSNIKQDLRKDLQEIVKFRDERR